MRNQKDWNTDWSIDATTTGADDALLIFCHCPKTAGTSLFRAIRNVVGPHRSYMATRSRPNLAALRRRGIRFVGGHVPYDHYRAQMGTGVVRFITFVRDPGEVMLSLFYHYARHRHLSARITHFFDIDLPAAGIDAGSSEAISLFFATAARAEPFLPDNPQVRFAVNRMSGPVGHAELEKAKANLAAMEVVGNPARFADSLSLMATRFGWKNIQFGHHNAAHGSKPAVKLPPEVTDLCALDRELVEWADRRFSAAWDKVQTAHYRANRLLPVISFLPTPRHRMNMAWLRDWTATVRMYDRDDWRWWLAAKFALFGNRCAVCLRGGIGQRLATANFGRTIRREFRTLVALAIDQEVGIWPRVAVAAGASYLFMPLDLIPDSIPWVGHVDEIGFLIVGLVLARMIMPAGVVMRASDP